MFVGGGGGVCKIKTFKEVMRLNWNFQRCAGEEGLEKNPFHG